MYLQVVCEEAPELYSYGTKTKRKERFLAGIVSPASPNYVHGLVDVPGAQPLESPPPLLGVAASVAGYTASTLASVACSQSHQDKWCN